MEEGYKNHEGNMKIMMLSMFILPLIAYCLQLLSDFKCPSVIGALESEVGGKFMFYQARRSRLERKTIYSRLLIIVLGKENERYSSE